jgi:outer membrane protein TolC
MALQTNPDLAVARKTLGIAQAGIVISQTYPFNPVWQQYYLGAGGPSQAFISTRLTFNENMRLDLELRGQGHIRRNAAQAALSRAEWDVANQELLVAVRTIRAYQTLVYRREKVRGLVDAVRLQEEAVKKIEPLVNQGAFKKADQLMAQADLVEARAALGPARALQVASWNDLRRGLGIAGDIPPLQGGLDAAPEANTDGLDLLAKQRRPDLHALEMVVTEADQRVRLEIANRYGNPSVGPTINYNARADLVAAVGDLNLIVNVPAPPGACTPSRPMILPPAETEQRPTHLPAPEVRQVQFAQPAAPVQRPPQVVPATSMPGPRAVSARSGSEYEPPLTLPPALLPPVRHQD